jgi:hypothetical protein
VADQHFPCKTLLGENLLQICRRGSNREATMQFETAN